MYSAVYELGSSVTFQASASVKGAVRFEFVERGVMPKAKPDDAMPHSVYTGERVALLTQHGKEQVMAPALEGAFGCRVEHVTGYDTDMLGTFTRETARAGTQLEAARKKACLGMELSGLLLGIASEGSFGPNPYIGMFPWNVELIVWRDVVRNIEVVGMGEGATNFSHLLTGEWETAQAFAREAQFPGHSLVVRPDSDHGPSICKGIANWPDLELAFSRALTRSSNGVVFIETDMRASANPTRMEVIGRAAEDLARKLRSLCPACESPGFCRIGLVPGLQCSACGTPTGETRAETLGCPRCPFRDTRELTNPAYAPPAACGYCNP